MKWFNVAVTIAFLTLYGLTSTGYVEENSWQSRVVEEVNFKFADLTDVSPQIYKSDGAEAIPLNEPMATQFYLRYWFGTLCWVMAGLNIAFYAGQISRRGNGRWEIIKQAAYNKTCDRWDRRPWRKKQTPADTTEVFESV